VKQVEEIERREFLDVAVVAEHPVIGVSESRLRVSLQRIDAGGNKRRFQQIFTIQRHEEGASRNRNRSIARRRNALIRLLNITVGETSRAFQDASRFRLIRTVVYQNDLNMSVLLSPSARNRLQ
jgi:hypothetical protein